MSDTRFDAFISYSRGASASLAAELQSAIERFAKPWYRLRAVRIFRDDSSMSASTTLWSNIERALIESEWFILLASPQAAASEWVTKELRWWLSHKSADRILIVLDEGRLTWDAAAGDFDWARTTAVGRVLARAFAEEPRWVELDWFEAEGSLGRQDPRWPERVADLAAAVRFAERDQLVGENVREHRRARRLLKAGVVALSVLLVASLVATGIAVVQGNEARDQARISLARQLAAQALALRPTDIQLASLLAVAAYRMHDDEQTSAALFQTATASPQLDRTFQADETVAQVIGADNASTVVAGTTAGDVLVWRTDTGERTELGTIGGRVSSLAVSADASVIAAVRPGSATVWVHGQGAPLGSGGDAVAVSSDGSLVAVFDDVSTQLFARSGARFQPTVRFDGGAATMRFTDAGELVFLSGIGNWGRLDPATGALIDGGELFFPISHQGMTISGDGRFFALAPGGTDYDIYPARADAESDMLVATSQIAGPLALALSRDGSLLATVVDHAIYVSAVRSPTELAEPPRLLDGGGKATPNALDFIDDRYLVSVSGTQVLLWDLAQTSRITRAFEAPVPEDCRACGPPMLVVSPDGSRAVALTRSGGGGLVLYYGDAETAVVLDDVLGIMAATWLDDERLAYFDNVEFAVVVRSGPALDTVESRTPLETTGALAIVPLPGDRIGVLGADGTWFEAAPGGAVQARPTALGDVLADGPNVPSFAVAPDGSSAFVALFADGGAMSVTAVDTGTGDVLVAESGAGAAYASDSMLRVFARDRVWVFDPATGGLQEESVPASVDTLPPPLLSPDGRVLVHGGLDGTIEFVDLRRWGSALGTMAVPDQENSYSFSGFSGDGARLYTAVQAMESNGGRSSVRITDMTVTGWIAALCATAGRDLTWEEWAIYTDSERPEDLGCEAS